MSARIGIEYNPLCWIIDEPIGGEDCWIGPFTLLDGSGGLTIGHNCSISAGVHIYTHQSGAGRGADIERKPVVLGNGIYVGPNAVISMGVTIGDGAVIGCNSWLNRDVPAGEKWAGNPAKRIVT